MRRQVTQAELRKCLDLEKLISRKMIQIRERMKKGAAVEPGELGARYDGSEDFSPECDNYSNMGLHIADAGKSVESHLRWYSDREAKERRSKLTVSRGGNLEVARAAH